MGELANLNLIRLFGFYLWIYLFLSILRRFRFYRSVASLVFEVPGRWPRLMRVLSEHRVVFLTWATFRPAIFTFVLTVVYMIAVRIVWPSALVRPVDLADRWWTIPFVGVLGVAMIAFDLYAIIQGARFQREQIITHLDQAEYWLKSWKAPVLRFVTLGYVDPRRMVREEISKAMLAGRDLLNETLWWMSIQLGLRVTFGLALWSVWAIYHNA